VRSVYAIDSVFLPYIKRVCEEKYGHNGSTMMHANTVAAVIDQKVRTSWGDIDQ